MADTDGGAPDEAIAADRESHFDIGARQIRSLVKGPSCMPRYLATGAILMLLQDGRFFASHAMTAERVVSHHGLTGTI